ncbi:MAG: hypothetical protein HYY23_05865 [Verrucomicrobia bacterium]|nr:hypothetical protein [Verrucomicrobiota bacterium]
MNPILKAIFRFTHCGVAVVSLLLLGTGCGAKTPKNALAYWKTFSPPGGNFSITMPPNPVEESPKTSTGFEAKTYRIVSAMSILAGLAVGYSDPPANAAVLKDPKKILDAVQKQALSDLRGELISEKPITHKNYPGREFLASVKGGYTVRQRIFLANKRMYSLMVIAGSKGLESPEAQTFFDSFQILN